MQCSCIKPEEGFDKMKKIITIMGIAGAILATGFSAYAGETLDRVMEKKAMVVATNAG